MLRHDNIIIYEDKSDTSNIIPIKPSVDAGLVLYSPVDVEIGFREATTIYLGLLLTIPKNMYCIVDSKYTITNHNIKLPDQTTNYIQIHNSNAVNGLSIKKGEPIAEIFLLETVAPRLITRSNKIISKSPIGPDGKPIYDPFEEDSDAPTIVEIKYK